MERFCGSRPGRGRAGRSPGPGPGGRYAGPRHIVPPRTQTGGALATWPPNPVHRANNEAVALGGTRPVTTAWVWLIAVCTTPVETLTT